eukprot:CAMPEP_0202946358 /NCGR_PEP_ID=MMETSP1395-20130829/9164_1 /ASSEMBLY_ACC=CAM_ASM_000871 /TAXON_ID=5961 /ORGANISM="Blepharisma japonicum, Strain Stock R1072" /LENGTH=80 /DNA_ID=CAMNT_0049646899 /DNA_START=588 /DNA_END=828 /DNA_ORIENTATION=+
MVLSCNSALVEVIHIQLTYKTCKVVVFEVPGEDFLAELIHFLMAKAVPSSVQETSSPDSSCSSMSYVFFKKDAGIDAEDF